MTSIKALLVAFWFVVCLFIAAPWFNLEFQFVYSIGHDTTAAQMACFLSCIISILAVTAAITEAPLKKEDKKK